MNSRPFAIGAILYPGFEMLDLFGPLEMFSLLGSGVVQIHMVAEGAGPVAAAMGVEVGAGPKAVADYAFHDAPLLDMLLLPGGFGTMPALENAALLEFLRVRAEQAQVVASVCTGSAILAKAGLLDGHRATSNKQFFQLAVSQSDRVDWVERARWVEDGKFVTSSGVSAGMDMTLAIIERLFGSEAAETVTAAAEYTRHTNADEDPFADDLNALAGMLSSSP
jgi:putative intracellular protease/amidase